jgi:hypothetical protein
MSKARDLIDLCEAKIKDALAQWRLDPSKSVYFADNLAGLNKDSTVCLIGHNPGQSVDHEIGDVITPNFLAATKKYIHPMEAKDLKQGNFKKLTGDEIMKAKSYVIADHNGNNVHAG